MSQAELTRLEAMQTLKSRGLTQVQIATRLGLSERQVRRLWQRYQAAGAAGLVSRRRGRPSNNCLDPAVLERALELVSTRYADFGPTFANEKLSELHAITIGTETLRQAMIRAGLWVPKIKRRKKIHPPRERRPQFGELIQIDGSPHDWFEGRAPRCSLIVFIDDATSKLINLRFVPAETTWAYMHTLRAAIERYGRPRALYSDKHSIFQAKGRVERANSTLQRRLIRELRLEQINSMTAANEYLPRFIDKHNARFACEPASQVDAHRDLDGLDLNSILAIKKPKRLSKDRTIQLNRDVHLVDDPRAYQYQRVVLVEHQDATYEILDEDDGAPLSFHRLRSLSEQPPIQTSKELNAHLDKPARIGKKTYTPPLNHPWRTKLTLPESPP